MKEDSSMAIAFYCPVKAVKASKASKIFNHLKQLLSPRLKRVEPELLAVLVPNDPFWRKAPEPNQLYLAVCLWYLPAEQHQLQVPQVHLSRNQHPRKRSESLFGPILWTISWPMSIWRTWARPQWLQSFQKLPTWRMSPLWREHQKRQLQHLWIKRTFGAVE